MDKPEWFSELEIGEGGTIAYGNPPEGRLLADGLAIALVDFLTGLRVAGAAMVLARQMTLAEVGERARGGMKYLEEHYPEIYKVRLWEKCWLIEGRERFREEPPTAIILEGNE